MRWQSATVLPESNAVEIPDTWLFIHYYDALSALFRIENALRLFVYVVLKARFEDKWASIQITSDDSNDTTILALAKKRVEQAKVFGYLSFPVGAPLMQLTSGELVRLITHDSYWEHFAEFFQASKSVVALKLQEIGAVRNSLAHFRPIQPDDVEVVKQNAKQMLAKIERSLEDMVQCDQVVPSNTSEGWYAELRTLGTDNVTLQFSQSQDARWVQIRLRYRPEILSTTMHGPDHIRYRVTTIRTPDVLREFEQLRKPVVFVTERVPAVRVPKDRPPTFEKHLLFTFGQALLRDHQSEIKTAFEALLTRIGSEMQLLGEDQLARGSVLHVAPVSAALAHLGAGEWWGVDTKALSNDVATDDPVEYWGKAFTSRDLISDTERYPWMPVKVSEERVPF